MNTLTTDLLPARTAAVAAAVGFLTIAVFHAALALGAPLGRAAWGGTHAQLPTGLRVGQRGRIRGLGARRTGLLGRAGFDVSPLPTGLLRWGTWTLVGMLALGAGLNFASPSNWEPFLWGPIALLVATLCLLLARSAATPAGG
jgi:hypothetical protein